MELFSFFSMGLETLSLPLAHMSPKEASSFGYWWAHVSTIELMWLAVGFIAQIMFSMRFIIQWIASEKAKASIVPEYFWYFSFIGGAMLFAYAVYRLDPVFIMGQGTGLLIYARNIWFIWYGENGKLPGGKKPQT